MFSDVGPGCRWVGNESGVAGETSWSTFSPEGFSPGAGSPPRDTLSTGNVHGSSWVPAETDVSIRPGWFWKESENDKVKSLKELLDIYYTSVGRNSLLLLGLPPDATGHVNPADSSRLLEFGAAVKEIFRDDLSKGAKVTASSSRGRGFRAGNILDGEYDSYWSVPDGVLEASLTFDLGAMKTFNRIVIQEYIPLGQRIRSFMIEACDEQGGWKEIASGTTIGYKRILRTEDVAARKVRLNITGAFAPPTLNGFGLYMDRISR